MLCHRVAAYHISYISNTEALEFNKHRIFLSQVSGRVLTNIHVKFVVDEIQKILNENSSENEIQEAEGFEIGPQEETRNRVCFKSFFPLFIFFFL